MADLAGRVPTPVECPHGTEGCLYCNTRWHKAEGRSPSRSSADDASGWRHGPDTDCASCYECPGCGGADGSTPKRAEIRVAPGIARLICLDCEGAGVLCPNYDPQETP